MKRYYCTYFDRNYLIKGLSLIRSLSKYEEREFRIFVICLDEITRIILRKLNINNVVLIPLHDIEKRDFQLLKTKKTRSTVEYYWTATPTIILRLLEWNPSVDLLTYLDSDLYFYSSPAPIYNEIRDYSVLIHEHRFSPSLRHLNVYGKYNVGLLCFRNNLESFKVLNWWREKCIDWCYAYPDKDRFADQKYLDDWTERFKCVGVLKNIGAGVAPWNHEQYSYKKNNNGNILVNGSPLIFYHFHSLIFVEPNIIIPTKFTEYPLKEQILRLIFIPYLNSLLESIEDVKNIMSDFSFGLYNIDVLNQLHTFFVKKEIFSPISNMYPNTKKITMDKNWICFCGPQVIEFEEQSEVYIEKNLFEIKPSSLNDQAILKLQQGDRAGAKEAFLEIIKNHPSFYPAYNNLACLYWDEGDFENAERYFEEAIEVVKNQAIGNRQQAIEEGYRSVIMGYGEMLMRLKKYKKAKELFEEYLKNNPEDKEVKGMFDKCEKVLEKVKILGKGIG